MLVYTPLAIAIVTAIATAQCLCSQGNDVECSGLLTEIKGRLHLDGTIGNCTVSANVAVVGDTLHLFTDVSRDITILDKLVVLRSFPKCVIYLLTHAAFSHSGWPQFLCGYSSTCPFWWSGGRGSGRSQVPILSIQS